MDCFKPTEGRFAFVEFRDQAAAAAAIKAMHGKVVRRGQEQGQGQGCGRQARALAAAAAAVAAGLTRLTRRHPRCLSVWHPAPARRAPWVPLQVPALNSQEAVIVQYREPRCDAAAASASSPGVGVGGAGEYSSVPTTKLYVGHVAPGASPGTLIKTFIK